MPIHTYIVTDDDHDAVEESDGTGFDVTQTIIKIGALVQPEHCGILFEKTLGGWLIPPGADILYAWLQVYADGGGGDREPRVNIHANAVDNAVDFVDDADVKTRFDTTKTQAFVHWEGNGLDNQVYSPDPVSDPSKGCPDLKEVIQEIVDRPGWTKGNSICLLFDSFGGGGLEFDFRGGGHASASTTGPKLTIAWAQNAQRSFGRTMA